MTFLGRTHGHWTGWRRRSGVRRRGFVWMEWSGELCGALEPRRLLTHFSKPGPSAEVQIAARSRLGSARTVNLPDAMVYIPAGLQPGERYPMVVDFTPDGKLKRTLSDWQTVANRFHWIIYASKQFSDKAGNAAPDFGQFAATIQSSVEAALADFPVDRTRVVMAGFSGGGFMAEYLNARNPGLAAALVIDANGLFANGADPEVPNTSNQDVPFPVGEFATSRQLAAFLYSPTDRVFGSATRADRAFYQQQGWDTLLLTYPGGHVDAPSNRYLRAATWITTQPAWLSNPSRSGELTTIASFSGASIGTVEGNPSKELT